MDTLTNIPKRTALYGAMLAMTALVIALVAVTFATGPAQAQSKTYPDPQPCGQGHAEVSKKPATQITTGEIVFFDAYWDINTKTINNNLCPPAMVEKKQGRKTVTARADAKIDIASTVMHVTDDYLVTVVADNPGANQISLAEYPFLREALGLGKDEAPAAGTQVYWLRLDDPDTKNVDETSDLALGFSTALFEAKYWAYRDGDKPFQYEFESERDDIEEVHGPHFFAFEAPKANNGAQHYAVWNSYDAKYNQLQLDAGEKFHKLQWVFTEPGSHHIEVHIKGHVNLDVTDASEDWKKNLPEEKTVTSEVRRYTIQTGRLSFHDQPIFFAGDRSVAGNAATGTFINGPIEMVGITGSDIKFELIEFPYGGVSKLFEPYPWDPDGNGVRGVQLRVKDGPALDDDFADSYTLKVNASDGKDWLGHPDNAVDSSIVVRVRKTATE